MAVRLDIEYDGSAFAGWAAQPARRTVQGELETALATILRRAVQLVVAGRTDAGVHAVGQVASFPWEGEPPPELLRGLNGTTPRDVAVTSVAQMPTGFDARRDALSRTYVYRVLTRSVPSPLEEGRALWWPHGIDRDVLDACAATLPGEHDFTAFTPTRTEHVRFSRVVMEASWAQEREDLLVFRIEADAFMRNMVRALVGTMLEAAGGRRTAESFAALLNGVPRSEGGDTAPPHGLYLESVRY